MATENSTIKQKASSLRVVPFSPHEKYIAHDLIADLRDIIRLAEAGEVVGMAYAFIRPNFDYALGITGKAVHNPEMMNGYLSQLMYRLNQIANKK